MDLTTKCFEGENWSDVSLEKFLECDQNLAFNRQTRMLADLSLVGCYSNIFNLTSNHLDRLILSMIIYHFIKFQATYVNSALLM